jgi:hypothetical protein
MPWVTTAASRGLGWLVRTAVALQVGLGVLGCGDAEQARPVSSRAQPLAQPGPWQMPEVTRALGDCQYVPYTGAGAWVGESGCSGGVAPHAAALGSLLLARFEQIQFISDYACRPNTNGGTTRMSLHAVGRALDLHIPTTEDGAADNDAGDPVANWLVEHAQAHHVQYLIWDGWQWRANLPAGKKDGRYGGANPHHDHIHVEVALRADDSSASITPAQSAVQAPLECSPLPPLGGIVEEHGPCFACFGPQQYWREEQGLGHDGSLYWTDAFHSQTPSNWARWQIALLQAGEYDVHAYVDQQIGRYASVRYVVSHASGQTSVSLDQSAAGEWAPLGRFAFDAGRGQQVSIFDNSEADVARDEHIAVDAIRLTRVDVPAADSPSADWVSKLDRLRVGQSEDSDAAVRSASVQWGAKLAALRVRQSGDGDAAAVHSVAEADAHGTAAEHGASCGCNTSLAPRSAVWIMLPCCLSCVARRRRRRQDGDGQCRLLHRPEEQQSVGCISTPDEKHAAPGPQWTSLPAASPKRQRH